MGPSPLPDVDDIPKEVPKPYTTPKGYVPPTMGEQFRYVGRENASTRPPVVAFDVRGAD